MALRLPSWLVPALGLVGTLAVAAEEIEILDRADARVAHEKGLMKQLQDAATTLEL